MAVDHKIQIVVVFDVNERRLEREITVKGLGTVMQLVRAIEVFYPDLKGLTSYEYEVYNDVGKRIGERADGFGMSYIKIRTRMPVPMSIALAD